MGASCFWRTLLFALRFVAESEVALAFLANKNSGKIFAEKRPSNFADVESWLEIEKSIGGVLDWDVKHDSALSFSARFSRVAKLGLCHSWCGPYELLL